MWNLRSQKAIANVPEAHDGFVRGLTALSDGARFLSCGDDKTVKIWRMPTDADRDRAEQIVKVQPVDRRERGVLTRGAADHDVFG